MRLELHPQRAELCLDELGLERRLLGLLVPDPLGVFERVADSDQARVGHEDLPVIHVISWTLRKRYRIGTVSAPGGTAEPRRLNDPARLFQ